MKPDGIVAFHVSNRFLDLVPVVGAARAGAGRSRVTLVSDSGKDDDDDHTTTDWVLVSRDPARRWRRRRSEAASPEPPEEQPGWRTWTDDYSNLVQILK